MNCFGLGENSIRKLLNDIVEFGHAKSTIKQIKMVIRQCLEEACKRGQVSWICFYIYRGKGRLRVHPKSITKMKKRIKELTSRSNGRGYEERRNKLNEYVRGNIYPYKL